MRVAYQGQSGAYSEQALIEFFGDIETHACTSFSNVFDSVASGGCDAGIVPIENSLAGSVYENYDLLSKHELYIIGEYILRVRHCLIALPGVEIADIKKAISHPQALAQTGNYLRSHGISAEPVYNTAGAVKMLKESNARDTAAIASRRAAEIYGMQILAEGIEDHPENYTRFLVISKKPITPVGISKTSLVFSLKERIDKLPEVLQLFTEQKIELTKFETRPIQGKPWKYHFFIDFIDSAEEKHVRMVLDKLKEITLMLRMLGSYPQHIAQNGSK